MEEDNYEHLSDFGRTKAHLSRIEEQLKATASGLLVLISFALLLLFIVLAKVW